MAPDVRLGVGMDALLGRSLGPYELGERLGAGGMGAVYHATHRLLRHERAVKVLPGNLPADTELVQRFLREATTAAALHHPNIVEIYDVGEQEGLHYIVMELVPGHSLHQIIRQGGPVPLERALRLLGQLGAALDFAHARGIAHRDVKPANVIVGDDDHVTLVDFGIAHAASITRLTRAGSIVGTLEYLAPESITGSDDSRSADLYALGVVAYELLVGRTPFQGSAATLLYAVVHTPPPPPRQYLAELPEAVEPVLLGQLAKDPAERYPSAGDFVEALDAARLLQKVAPTDLSPPTIPLTGPVTIVEAAETLRPSLDGKGSTTNPTSPHADSWRKDADRDPAEGAAGVRSRTGSLQIAAATPPAVHQPGGRLRGNLLLAATAVLAVATGALAAAWWWQMGQSTSSPQIAVQHGTAVVPTVNAPATVVPAIATPTAPPTATLGPPTATATPPTPSPAQRMQAAQDAIVREEFPAALTILKTLVREAPSTPGLDDLVLDAHLKYGTGLLAEGQLDKSYAQFGQALAIRPGHPAALDGQKQVVLTKNYAAMETAWGKDDEAAEAALEENMALDPEFRETRQKLYALLIAKADRLLEAGDRPAAFAVLTHALEVRPDGDEARQRLLTYTPTPTPPTPVPPAPVQSQPKPVAPQPAQAKPAAPAPQPAPAALPTKVLPGPSP